MSKKPISIWVREVEENCDGELKTCLKVYLLDSNGLMISTERFIFPVEFLIDERTHTRYKASTDISDAIPDYFFKLLKTEEEDMQGILMGDQK